MTSVTTVDVQVLNSGLELSPIGISGLNWSATESAVTVNSGIEVTLPGVSGMFPVVSGTVHVTYRALDTTITGLNTITASDDPALIFGSVDFDSGLGYAVAVALQNSAGSKVFYSGVPTNDTAGFLAALDAIADVDLTVAAPYGLVPVTTDSTIQQAIIGNVNAFSAKTIGRWRDCWLATPTPESEVLLESSPTTTGYYALNGASQTTFVIPG